MSVTCPFCATILTLCALVDSDLSLTIERRILAVKSTSECSLLWRSAFGSPWLTVSLLMAELLASAPVSSALCGWGASVPASTLLFDLLGSGVPANADAPSSRMPRVKYFVFMRMLHVWLRDLEGPLGETSLCEWFAPGGPRTPECSSGARPVCTGSRSCRLAGNSRAMRRRVQQFSSRP